MVRAWRARDLDRLGNNGAGGAREIGWLGNDGTDEAADFGCSLAPGYPRPASVFIAMARAVVNHDGEAGTSLDPVVWSVGCAPKRRRVVHAVRDRAFLPGPAGIWDGEWGVVAATPITCHEIELWPYSVSVLVKWVAFFGHTALASGWG